jgi:hypothetical protein
MKSKKNSFTKTVLLCLLIMILSYVIFVTQSGETVFIYQEF